jgi:hypothetical protein
MVWHVFGSVIPVVGSWGIKGLLMNIVILVLGAQETSILDHAMSPMTSRFRFRFNSGRRSGT